MRCHLTQRLHEEQHHNTDQPVSNDSAARPGGRDSFAGCNKQTGADSAADGDHLHMTCRKTAFQISICSSITRIRC